jgi:hypothetical protein
MTVTAAKIDSSHESGKNFITWAWPAATTIIYNNPACLLRYQTLSVSIFVNLIFLIDKNIKFFKLQSSLYKILH